MRISSHWFSDAENLVYLTGILAHRVYREAGIIYKKKVRLAVHNMHTGIMQAFNSMCISKKLDVTVTRETQSFH